MDWTCETLLIGILLIYNSVITSAEVSLTVNFDEKPYKFMEYRTQTVFECNATVPMDNYVLKWKKFDEFIENPDNHHVEMKASKLIIKRTTEDDIANYSCVLYEKDNQRVVATSEIIVGIGKPYTKIQIVSPYTNPVVEGGTIKLECLAFGKPFPNVEWKKDNMDLTTSERIILSDSKQKQNLAHGILEIKNAQMSDRGTYSCTPHNTATQYVNSTEASVLIRVKDKLAALWPFLGICAEVFVLCFVIFIYERKRNKAELDESDTDQSPEQKNTPDHGKESVRQRK